ncbi:short-chain oxidoreductase [Catenovulum sp. SM1970]|uniref:IucA/IucC family protein n=1 Tax=Marinifaba aquimaris TaxID=2741323 RepID=UPI001572AA66|nr:IucA/IucC family protein [Marinifaba aquimaris]NTS78834.1 short-chain oxidoreductase [Marinifaba aquimaris]
MMPLNAIQVAEHASFQAFANCYLREIDPGVWHSASEWQLQTGLRFSGTEVYALEIQLTGINKTLALGVGYRSSVGRHIFTQAFIKDENEWTWQSIAYLSATFMLIDNIYADNPEQNQNKVELLTRTLESQQIMKDYLVERGNDETLKQLDFIASEQSLLFGHWLHPTPKSRQGIHLWQHKNYTPELKAQFKLHFFAISRQLLKQNSMIEACAEQIINQIAELDSNAIDADKQLVPVHPLQAHWLLHQDYLKDLISSGDIVDLGVMGKTFTPTSSVRTLYCAELDYMIKLSIPVKITNSLRQNMAHELEAGMNVGKLIKKSDFKTAYPQFSMILDPAYITVELPGMEESGFETILRHNPFTQETNNTLSIAALTQDPILPGAQSKLAQQVHALAEKQLINIETAASIWFDSYWRCAIEPSIWLYEKHGVALEAHQQNSLLTITDHTPSHYYYRDNQGFYLSETLKETLIQQEPALKVNDDLFYQDDMIADRFGYYLFINQLFSIISRLGQDQLISEQKLLVLTYKKLIKIRAQLSGVGLNFIEQLLLKATLPSKANLLTRVEDVDELQAEQELAVYTEIANPFFALHQQSQQIHDQLKEVKLASA